MFGKTHAQNVLGFFQYLKDAIEEELQEMEVGWRGLGGG